MRRTKEQAAETGRQVLRAAEALFLEHGYDKVSLEQIAAAAGVTRGAVHWHFKNKHGLLMALRDDAQEPFRHLAHNLDGADGEVLLRQLEDAFLGAFRKLEGDPRQKGLVRVLLRLDLASSETGGSTFRDEMRANVMEVFRALDRSIGLTPPWTPETAASTLAAAVSGLVGEWALDKGDFQLGREGQDFLRMMLSAWSRGRGPQPSAPR